MTDNNENKVLNVPHLRFPEFSGEWETKSINDLADVIGGGTPDTTVKSYWDGGIQWFTPSEIGKNKFVDASLRTITEDGLNNSSAKLLPPNTILLSSRATIGECSLSLRECATNQGFQSLVSKNCNVDFLYYLIQTKKKDLIRKSCGSTFLEISANEVRKIQVSVPSDVEQQKIAELLSLIDKRIATQNKIIEKYESLIKGIIYQTKSTGLAHNTWQKTELKKVLQERNEKNANGYDVCSVSVTQGIVNQIEYLGRSFASKDTLHYNVVKYGDIVYTKSPTGDFPYGIVKRSNVKYDVAISPLYGVYKPVNNFVGIILHFYFMQPNNALNYLHPLIQKGAKNTINITNGRFLENTIPLPKKEDETKHLAWVLTSIQNKIILEQDLLHSYQKQKQYLLRQMFI
ncbi:restriction endonuclease subunit S [Bacteroides hominis]|jgi:type I restriction enzyme S subunit|uniref:Restriction endonuclease subunit S n=2 Tax=Bacteroides uniformis TaxID=820 RepID=A0A1Y3V156_BACUN|nr:MULTISPECIES: restriction endonuclease subunit S [Bacteroides]MDV6173458.1 restriction endonuclease subunit S [Bacteroides hominis (ex Liu et al. 2022)]OUN54813.1 restriction endonuclease subunit S [Bacteroides uniformis]UVP08632.1 restriction endonuclease subunit S [Bacteroides fragilis]UVP99973.1 restriction endonuclease subunit S [Bacteroides fragilis]